MDRRITLPAKPSDTLDWAKELAAAQHLIDQNQKVIWRVDLGLESPFFPLEDEFRFQSICLGLKQFTDQVWPHYAQQTEALYFYQGSADFNAHFLWSERQEMNYKSWLVDEEIEDSPHAKRLFTAECFAIYFQMLSHRLPDEIAIFLLLDLRGIDSSFEAMQIIGKERFAHFLIARKSKELPLDGYLWNEKGIEAYAIDTNKGIVFPENKSFGAPFELLLKKHPDGKIVQEAFLTEEWGGLDQLVVVPGSMSSQGQRKLSGFLAAGGEIL